MNLNYIERTEGTFHELTKGMKKVANYLLGDPTIFAIYPAKKVGEIIGVSETMVIRFSTTIGYTGYAPLQKEVRSELMNGSQYESKELETDQVAAHYAQSMMTDIHYVRSNLDEMDEATFQALVDTIINSERLIIAGYYRSFTFAHWLYFNVNYILGNATLYQSETDAGLLDLLPQKSCIVIFSFFRYALDTLRLAEEAKNKNIKVIAITDSRVSPITEHADIILPISAKNSNLFSKGPITLSIINAILNEIIQKTGEKSSIHETYKYFVKDGEN